MHEIRRCYENERNVEVFLIVIWYCLLLYLYRCRSNIKIKRKGKESLFPEWSTSIESTDVPEAISQARPTNEKIPFFPDKRMKGYEWRMEWRMGIADDLILTKNHLVPTLARDEIK